ncbi:MAG TPA: S41 family peptidase [Azospirillaceae bacterium]|nr:S41 family peptidase [Azospirillaceae bacterium]
MRRHFAGLVIGLMTVGGCASDRGMTDVTRQPFNEQIFTIGYDRITEIYLQPVDLARLATDGLAGLRSLDSRLGVERSETRMRLLLDGRAVEEFPLPDKATAAESWARLTARVVDAARALSPALRQAASEQIYQAVFDAMMLDLDAYSRYTAASRAAGERAQREGYGGIGVTLEAVDGLPVVRTLDQHSPAARAGMKSGEVILAIDDEPTTGQPLREVVERLRGPSGSLTLITVGPKPDEGRRLALRRERVIPNTVTLAVDQNIGIFRIERFNASTTANLREAIKTARRALGSRATGFVLDLRSNPGGLLDQAVAVADLFIAGGRIITTEGRHPDSRQHFDANPDDLIDGLPLVVLVDGRSASASEIVAAALQDSGRAIVVGTSSFGKGSVQTVTRLPNDGELFLTWSRIYTPAGYTLHREGVLPTICTSRNGSPDSVIADLRDGRLTLPPRIASWRATAPDDENALANLREACPAKPHEADLELKVAKQVLADRTLYRRALALTNTAVAQR